MIFHVFLATLVVLNNTQAADRDEPDQEIDKNHDHDGGGLHVQELAVNTGQDHPVDHTLDLDTAESGPSQPTGGSTSQEIVDSETAVLITEVQEEDGICQGMSWLRVSEPYTSTAIGESRQLNTQSEVDVADNNDMPEEEVQASTSSMDVDLDEGKKGEIKSVQQESRDPEDAERRNTRIQRFIMQPIEGDGNCFFRALADQLQERGIQTNVPYLQMYPTDHATLRAIACNALDQKLKKEKESMPYYKGPYGLVNIENMRKDGTYADHPTIQALAEYLGIRIYIHYNENRFPHVINERVTDPSRFVFLYLHQYQDEDLNQDDDLNHYDSLHNPEWSSPNDLCSSLQLTVSPQEVDALPRTQVESNSQPVQQLGPFLPRTDTELGEDVVDLFSTDSCQNRSENGSAPSRDETDTVRHKDKRVTVGHRGPLGYSDFETMNIPGLIERQADDVLLHIAIPRDSLPFLSYNHHMIVTKIEATDECVTITVVHNTLRKNISSFLSEIFAYVQEESFILEQNCVTPNSTSKYFGNKFYVIHDYEPRNIEEREEVRERISSVLGFRYSLTAFNCETFVRYALTGQGVSEQISNLGVVRTFVVDFINCLIPLDCDKVIAYVMLAVGSVYLESYSFFTYGKLLSTSQIQDVSTLGQRQLIICHVSNLLIAIIIPQVGYLPLPWLVLPLSGSLLDGLSGMLYDNGHKVLSWNFVQSCVKKVKDGVNGVRSRVVVCVPFIHKICIWIYYSRLNKQ